MIERTNLPILVVDDEADMLALYREVLSPTSTPAARQLREMESALFGQVAPAEDFRGFRLCACSQGDEAVAQTQAALAAGEPFAVAFIDYRMPPGPDGVTTAARLRALDPRLEIVLVSAYADLSSAEIRRRVPPVEKLLLLKKPLHVEEIRQVAVALTVKRDLECKAEQLTRALEARVEERTRELLHLSNHDPLTGLANRTALDRALQQGLECLAATGVSFGVLLLDLDRFKVLNDSLGHSVGDEVLRQLAVRFRAQSGPEEVLARFGGDEFVAVLPGPVSEADLAARAENLLAACREPLAVADRELALNGSIGLLLVDANHRTGGDLLRDADIAMYRAKKAGGGRWQQFRPELRQQLQSRLELEHQLRTGIAAGELELHYQPVVTLPQEQLTGLEALVRWRHPERGLVPPGEFIPLAEESGLILPLGAEVLRLACRQLRRWREAGGGPGVPVNVNISGLQLLAEDFVESLIATLEQEEVAPGMVVLEFTESVLMQQADEVISRLGQLRRAGFSLCLDDFGTGFSSLSYLQRFEVDTIKIDRSFIAGLDRPRTEALVRSLLFLGRRLGVKVVAEGIETVRQKAQLADWGCPLGQGFLFSRPVPPEDLAALLPRTAPAPAP